jgi:hypothetical protein
MSFVGDVIGSITGTKQAAKAQSKAADQSAQVQREMFEATQAGLAPFVQAGLTALPGIQQAMQPIDRTQALSDFYAGPEYAMMQQQASANQMAASEAMGGMGSTSTGNALASIAPQLGAQHLGMLEAQQMDQYNRGMGLLGMGQASAAQTGAAGQNYASGAAQAYQQAGAAKAGAAMAPFQMLGNLGGMALGGYLGGAF